MPSKCFVAGCRSNCNASSNKVRVFSFPRDEELKKLWIQVINREDKREPSKSSKVCEQHFKPEDIVTTAEVFDQKTKKYVQFPLQKCRLAKNAVPSIFDDLLPLRKRRKKWLEEPIPEKEDSQDLTTVETGTSMKLKEHRSPSITDASKESDEESMDSTVSEKASETPTTDRPFIAIIKPNDFQPDDAVTNEEVFDDTSSPSKSSPCSTNSITKTTSRSRNFSSPFKHFPSASGCLKEEDQLNVQKESKSKRSLSTCSNSSIGSSEAIRIQPKRRKVEKPAPTVIGRQNDCYCWVCHRENVLLNCIACPRAFHIKCAGENGSLSDWVCPECQKILTAENVDTRSSVLSEISLDKLCTLLRFSLNKMKHRAGVAFHQPVSLEHYPMYLHYVIHPMDFSLLEKNIKQKLYGCTEAFLSDVKWILHNSCVFNGNQHPLSTNAKSMVKACDNDMQEIEVCPDCFMHNIVRNKYWFSEVCHKPHPLVWAKLKGFPYWPAKVVRIADGNIDARFFGAHDRAWVPISQCYHLSKEMPTSSKPKKKGNYETALDELSVHVQLLIQKYGTFEYAPYRTTFDPENKHLMYHGINLDLASKEETPCNIPSNFENQSFSPFKSEAIGGSKEFDETIDSDRFKITTDLTQSSEITLDETSTASKKESKLAESEHKAETSQTSSDKQASPLTDRKKIELALQRIKGYITNDLEDEEKDSESAVPSSIPNELPLDNKEPAIDEKDRNKDEICLSNLIKVRSRPPINLPPLEEPLEKEAPLIIETTKKNDLFSLKLIETIKSCKAKLGISGDLDKSESHESDSADEDEEEYEDEEESEDEEDEDNKVGKAARLALDSAEEDASGESSSESDEESASSGTDIEMVEDIGKDADQKDAENITEKTSNDVQSSPNKDAHSNDVQCSPNKDALSKDVNAESNIVLENASSVRTTSPEVIDCVLPESRNENVCDSQPAAVSATDNCPEVVREKSAHLSPAARSRSVSSNAMQSSTDDLTDTDLQLDAVQKQSASQPNETQAEAIVAKPLEQTPDKNPDANETEDDEIYILPLVKPPTPPLICLDDGTETEPEEAMEDDSNKNGQSISPAIKLPPPDKDICPENTEKYVSILKNAKLIPQNARKTAIRSKIREISTEDSSDEEVEVSPKVPLSGAIRTFNNRERSTFTGPQVNFRPEMPFSSILVPGVGMRQISSSTAMSNNSESNGNAVRNEADRIDEVASEETISGGDLTEKDAEIFKLRKKLRCIFSAFQLQQWKSVQEKSELRHNMNLIVMEMRASLEADKKQTIENLTRTLEQEKQRHIEETKKKQWCAFCQQESRYACCWNTSYCTVTCQKRHFSEHRNSCTQLKPKANGQEIAILPTADTKEGKKVFVVNVLPKKDLKAPGDSAQERSQLTDVSKQSAQLVTTPTSQANTPFQYTLVTSLKPGSSPLAPSAKPMTPKVDYTAPTHYTNDWDTAVSTPKELWPTLKKIPEKAEPSLEEIYFPSPPMVCFEGLDTALPDENVHFTMSNEPEHNNEAESHASDNDLSFEESLSEEEDIAFSENDEANNEMINIGRGIEIKVKYLNKCLIYGKDFKKLTRCLVDVIFPGNLLALCSAFGNKSNVTKLTKAALPRRKVEAIIDFVSKRYPDALRSKIVQAINMKCKEARMSLERAESGEIKRKVFPRLLAKEQKDAKEKLEAAASKTDTEEKPQEPEKLNQNSIPTTETSTSSALVPVAPTTITVLKKTLSNVVCLQAQPSSTATSVTTSTGNAATGPNILRMGRQILIRPNYTLAPSKVVLTPPSTVPNRNRPATVRSLLNMQQSKDKNKLLVPVSMLQKVVLANPPVKNGSETGNATALQRPIILGSPRPRLVIPATQLPPSPKGQKK